MCVWPQGVAKGVAPNPLEVGLREEATKVEEVGVAWVGALMVIGGCFNDF